MGQVSLTRLLILTILFLITCVFVYWQPTSYVVKKQLPLDHAFTRINGWEKIGLIPLDQNIIEELNLDDFTYQNFSDGENIVSLYIGYYFTTKKVGAAHDPTLCFPGQGWRLSNTKEEKLILNPETGETISISLMTARKGEQNEVIIYWYQSYDDSSTDTFSQKVISFTKKFLYKREDNAFVRITISAESKPLSEYRNIMVSFIKAFYPVFLNYVRENSSG